MKSINDISFNLCRHLMLGGLLTLSLREYWSRYQIKMKQCCFDANIKVIMSRIYCQIFFANASKIFFQIKGCLLNILMWESLEAVSRKCLYRCYHRMSPEVVSLQRKFAEDVSRRDFQRKSQVDVSGRLSPKNACRGCL